MTWTVYAALLGWVPLTLCLFLALPRRTAAFMSLVLGHLFLPEAALQSEGLLDLGKSSVIGLGLLLGILICDPARLQTLRPSWYDTPMVVWCLVPLGSSLTNDLGIYDGVASMVGFLWRYGVPYLVGRLYVRNSNDLTALARAILLGAILYVPLCLYEVRMSPQLHSQVYGFHQHTFAQTRRFGGWRPTVFLQHGLAVGMWMASAALVAWGLWRSGRLAPILRIPRWLIAVTLLVTAVLCKSMGSLALLALGLATHLLSRLLRSRLPLLVLALLVPAYLLARIVFDWRAETLVAYSEQVNHDRALSLEGRIAADALLRDQGLRRPVFGWGGWNRIREGLPPLLTDSLWSLTLAQRGLIGLFSLFGAMVLAQVLPLLRLTRSSGTIRDHPEIAVMVTALALYALDCMVNAMLNPVYFAVAGALTGWHPGLAAPSSPPARTRGRG